MRLWEIRAEAEAARAAGKRYLLACYDVFDRARGDEDRGIYHVTCDSAQEVVARLGRCQLDEESPPDRRDVCEALVDLATFAGEPGREHLVSPRAWLTANGLALLTDLPGGRAPS